MNNTSRLVVLSFLLTTTILSLGCTEQVVQSPPSTFSQTFKQLLPDTNIQLFKAGENSGDCWKVDGNHFVLGNCVQFLIDMNIVGSVGQIPFLNADGNALELDSGFDYNKDTNTLRTNCVELGDGNTYCSSTDFPNPDLSGLVPYQGATNDINLFNRNITIKDIYIPDTDDSTGAVGIIYKAGVPFIHNYHKLFAVNGTTPLDGQNLFIGKDAGNFTMGATATATEHASNNLGIGKEALKSVTTGYDNVGIGALSSSKITSGRGNIYIGGNAGASTTTLSYNVGIGQNSVKSAAGSGGALTGVGYETLMNVQQGGGHVAFGTSAGRTINTGAQGSFIGYRAGYYARGDASTFLGSEAGYGGSSTSSSGTFNTAVGYQALRSFTSGQRNTAIGQTAGYSISSGQRNTIVGSEAMYGLTTGSYNTAIGESAGRYYSTGTSAHTSGTYSVFLGRLTRPLANGQTNQIVIGNDAVGFGSNTVTIGNNNIIGTYLKGSVKVPNDLNVGGKIVVDGNIVMTSPDGTQWNCGVSNLGNLECS